MQFGSSSGIDAKSDGGYVVGPGSLYSASKPGKEKYNGKPYEWVVKPDDDGALDVMPKWLLKILTTHQLVFAEKEETFEEVLITNDKPKQKSVSKTVSNNNHDDDFEISKEAAEYVVDHVDASRANDNDDWTRGVWGCASLKYNWALKLAVRFSLRTTRKNYGRVTEVFEESNGKVSFKTMIHWLKQDNPEAFEVYRAAVFLGF